MRAAVHSFTELAAAAEHDPGTLDQLAIDALPNPQRRVLAVLALAAGALLPADLLGAMSERRRHPGSHLRPACTWPRRAAGRPVRPAVCKVDTYRPQLLAYVDAGSAARELIRWLTSRDPAEDASLSVAEAALSLIGLAAEEGDLQTVLALVRVIEPILTLAGRWQQYSDALDQGMQAAQELGDQACRLTSRISRAHSPCARTSSLLRSSTSSTLWNCGVSWVTAVELSAPGTISRSCNPRRRHRPHRPHPRGDA